MFSAKFGMGGIFSLVERKFRFTIVKVKIFIPSGQDDYLKKSNFKPFKRLSIGRQ